MSGGYGKKFKDHILFKNKIIKNLFFKYIYPPMPTFNSIERNIIENIQSKIFGKKRRVLNFGCGISTGSGKIIWKTDLVHDCDIIHCDVLLQGEVSVVADAHFLPFKSNSFDSIICQAVIEHLHDPILFVKEMHRVLKPSGCIYSEVPFLQGFHADPDDFQRYTLEGLKILFKKFKIINYGVSVGPFCTLVWFLRDATSSFFSNKYFFNFVRFFISWLLSPIRFLDLFIRKKPLFQRLACENYILVKKPYYEE